MTAHDVIDGLMTGALLADAFLLLRYRRSTDAWKSQAVATVVALRESSQLNIEMAKALKLEAELLEESTRVGQKPSSAGAN